MKRRRIIVVKQKAEVEPPKPSAKKEPTWVTHKDGCPDGDKKYKGKLYCSTCLTHWLRVEHYDQASEDAVTQEVAKMAKAKKKAEKKGRKGVEGATWKLGISKTWEKLFIENEKKSGHKSDKELSAFMMKEFKGNTSNLMLPENVNKIRSLFNRDKLAVPRDKGTIKVQSVRYESGKPVEKGAHASAPKAKAKKEAPKKKVVIVKKK